MSRLTQCNFCTLAAIKKRAEAKGQTVEVRHETKSTDGPVQIFVDGRKSVWFMKLTDHCAC